MNDKRTVEEIARSMRSKVYSEMNYLSNDFQKKLDSLEKYFVEVLTAERRRADELEAEIKVARRERDEARQSDSAVRSEADRIIMEKDEEIKSLKSRLQEAEATAKTIRDYRRKDQEKISEFEKELQKYKDNHTCCMFNECPLKKDVKELEKEVERLNGIIKKQTEEIEVHFRNEENCYQNLCKDQKGYENKIKELEARLIEKDKEIEILKIQSTHAEFSCDKQNQELREELSKHKAVVEILEYVNEFFPEMIEVMKEILEDAKRCYVPEKGWPPHIESAIAMLHKDSDQMSTLQDVKEVLARLE